MSFDVNVLSSKPIIKAAASMQNDGGGGNLGYMSQGRQEQEGKKEEINIFAQKPDFDTFILKEDLEAPEDVEFTLIGFITEVLHSIKSLIK
ncbi:MAG: hypothetical protein E7Z93_03595 [Cyanobacteria bacterium SIG32]|nr:hypothetical protein [Cyanobacteria bacterium SIG32]